jgi:hypothetical protein
LVLFNRFYQPDIDVEAWRQAIVVRAQTRRHPLAWRQEIARHPGWLKPQDAITPLLERSR